MTNGANYKRGRLHHSPWHSDIRTSDQLNTCHNTSCAFHNVSCVSSNPILCTIQFLISPDNTCYGVDTSATRLCCSEMDIPANIVHLPLPVICILSRGGGHQGYNNNQWDSERLDCCFCCCWVSNCQMDYSELVHYPVTRFFGVAKERRWHNEICSSLLSKYWIIDVCSSTISVCFIPIMTSQGAHS